MQSLLGSLGAVDPDDHKYAALLNLSMSGRLSHYGRVLSTDSHGRSFLRGSSARASSQLAVHLLNALIQDLHGGLPLHLVGLERIMV